MTHDITPEQRAFYDACNKLREAWGNRNSTFEKICHLIANVITASTKEGVDQEKAASQVECIWSEWTRYRCFFFHAEVAKENKCDNQEVAKRKSFLCENSRYGCND